MCYDLLTRTLLYKYNGSSTIFTYTIHNISITTIFIAHRHKLHVLFVTLHPPLIVQLDRQRTYHNYGFKYLRPGYNDNG
jgi:hypothetical protein